MLVNSRNNLLKSLFLSLFLGLALACLSRKSVPPELVMPEGMQITVNSSPTALKILAGNGFERTYLWGECRRTITLYQREERWYGSLGIYYSDFGAYRSECEGVSRMVVEEGQQHFETVEAALAWIRSRLRLKGMEYVYNQDGLVVGWGTFKERKQLNVEVWQILIRGKKPTNLEGSDKSRLSVNLAP